MEHVREAVELQLSWMLMASVVALLDISRLETQLVTVQSVLKDAGYVPAKQSALNALMDT